MTYALTDLNQRNRLQKISPTLVNTSKSMTFKPLT